MPVRSLGEALRLVEVDMGVGKTWKLVSQS